MLKLTESHINDILHRVKDAYPRAWGNAHHEGHPERYDWNILAGKALQAENVKAGGTPDAIGCNWRRADVGDLSMDGLSVMGPDGRYYFADIIVGAGGPNARPNYRTPFNDASLLRDRAGQYAPHGFADPSKLNTHFQYDYHHPSQPDPIEPTTPACPDPSAHRPKPPKPYPGDANFLVLGAQLERDYFEAGQHLNGGAAVWFARVIYDHLNSGLSLEQAIDKHRNTPGGWRDALGLGR
jgi:hypothetical protein